MAQLCKVPHILQEEIAKPQKQLDLMDISWWGGLPHCMELVCSWLNSFFSQLVHHVLSPKGTFGQINLDLLERQMMQKINKLLQVLLVIEGVDQEFVHVHDHIIQTSFHELLET